MRRYIRIHLSRATLQMQVQYLLSFNSVLVSTNKIKYHNIFYQIPIDIVMIS